MVLGRIKKFANLNLQDSKAFLKVCPCAIVDKAKVFDCLLLSGVVYTNEVYNQIKTNDNHSTRLYLPHWEVKEKRNKNLTSQRHMSTEDLGSEERRSVSKV